MSSPPSPSPGSIDSGPVGRPEQPRSADRPHELRPAQPRVGNPGRRRCGFEDLYDAGPSRGDVATPKGGPRKADGGAARRGHGRVVGVRPRSSTCRPGASSSTTGPSPHQSHIALENRTARLGWQIALDGQRRGFEARVVAFDSRPLGSDSDRPGPRRPRADPQRRRQRLGGGGGGPRDDGAPAGDRGRGLDPRTPHAAELRHAVDRRRVRPERAEDPRRVHRAPPAPAAARERLLENVGLYGQAIVELSPWLSATGRRAPSIGTTSTTPTSAPAPARRRTPVRPWSAKLLYNTSFKAPSAEQLFTQPIGEFDILGNAQLGRPVRAQRRSGGRLRPRRVDRGRGERVLHRG